MHQWQVDQKRHYVNEKSRQLTLLAEICALLAAFSTIMLYEQGLPAPSEFWFSDVLLSAWTVSTLAVPVRFLLPRPRCGSHPHNIPHNISSRLLP